MGTRQRHIVMFPFMAQGHIIPFLALAKLMDQRNQGRLTITLVSTPLNIRNLRSSLSPDDSNILLRELPFSGADHGLPPDSENTDSLRHHHIIRLIQASETLQPHFEQLISDVTRRDRRPPLCIVADIFFGWTVGVAKKLNIFHATFTTCGCYGTAVYTSLWLHLPHRHTDSDEFAVPGLPESFRLHRSQLSKYMRSADGTDPWSIFFRRQIPLALGSNAMLCNTAEEVETAGARLLREYTGLRVWTVGPLLPDLDGKTSVDGRVGKKPGISSETCIEWLDFHPPASVLYVSFGSQNTVSAPQAMELAAGLEASGRAFLWVIRPPIGFDLADGFSDEWLPEGFEDRMRERRQGLLVRNWAPQLEILAHGSTGAFLSHCGWNSVLESLSRGVPIIGWPLASEQFYNSKMLEEELGVCVELARGVEENVGRGEVERVIELVMGGEKGAEMKRKAVEAAEKIRDAMRETGSSLRAIDEFTGTLLSKAQGY